MAGNTNLGAAKVAKNDEFYTQWSDIENEMQAYLEYDPDVFRGKTVLLPCDDPEWSNFTKYFVSNFDALGIEKLISTSYAPQGNGRILVMDKGSKSGGSIVWDYLDGDGDFRSEEVTALRDEADMVITNPPFSLFREFFAWLIEGEVEFSVVGNMNSVAYKGVFPLIKENKVWLGCGNSMWFEVPATYPENKNEKFTKEGSRIIPIYSKWFTNIQHVRKNEPLKLMTMDDNLRYNRRIMGSPHSYKTYDNYDAIEVPFTSGIPSDHEGVMGVPISFLDKYSPDQFEILGITKTWDDDAGLKKKIYPTQIQVSKNGTTSNVRKLNDGAVIQHGTPPENTTYYKVEGQIFTQQYNRVLIRHRNPGRKEFQPLSRSRGGQSSLRCKRGFSHVEVRG